MPKTPKGSFFLVSCLTIWEINPKPGRIKMYTSGCPKNQNKCWYKTGSPPPPTSKKAVFKFRSVKSIVTAPASTGRAKRRRTVVIRTDHAKSGTLSNLIPYARKLPIVLIKFTAPNREEIPAKCREKIAKSTDAPAWAKLLLSGGYTVHPVPAPLSTMPLKRSKIKAGSKNQNLILFNRGKAISGAPSIKGTSQLPKQPIKIGITMKKIIIKA